MGSWACPLSSHHPLWKDTREDILYPGLPRTGLEKTPREIPGHHHDRMLQLISDKWGISGWDAAQLLFQHSRPLWHPRHCKDHPDVSAHLLLHSPLTRQQAPERLKQSIRSQPRAVISHLQTLILMPEEGQSGQPRRTQDAISFTQGGVFTATATLSGGMSFLPVICLKNLEVFDSLHPHSGW